MDAEGSCKMRSKTKSSVRNASARSAACAVSLARRRCGRRNPMHFCKCDSQDPQWRPYQRDGGPLTARCLWMSRKLHHTLAPECRRSKT